MASRALKWTVLAVLIMASFFLASFNATLRYIVDQRREDVAEGREEERRRREEREAWDEAVESAKGGGVGAAPTPGSAGGEGGGGDDVDGAAAADENDADDVAGGPESGVADQDKEADATKKVERKREMERERENPTLGKYRTTIRPLDGFAEELKGEESTVEKKGVDGDGGEGEGEGDGDGEGSSGSSDDDEEAVPKFYDRPSIRSHSPQSRSHDSPHAALKSSAATIADAHYAKAIRMLSSDFDRSEGGGNALPHPVHGGEYDQGIEGRGGRGDDFVKLDAQRRRRHRRIRRMQKKFKKNGGRDGDGSGSETGGFRIPGDSKWELPEDEPILDVVLDAVREWFYDTADWIYERLGIEMDYGEGSDDIGGGDGGYVASNDEDVFSWKDTRVGSQLIWIYNRLASLWSRQRASSRSSSSQGGKERKEKPSDEGALSERDRIAREGLFHLEKAAELGHSEAQRAVAHSLASGVLPLSDHSLMRRLARRRHLASPEEDGRNWTSVLLRSTLRVPDDFSAGGQQLSRAVLLWHLSAMDGNVESAMALGYRHLYSASGGSTQLSDLATAAAGVDDGRGLSGGYHPVHGGQMTQGGAAAGGGGGDGSAHYGVLGTCPTALAYYEAAAHGVMDELEGGPTKGKVNPPMEEHRLAEIYTHGGASVALDSYNKPDELEEALQYYRMLASRNRSPEPDLVAAFTIANFYFHGYRGVKQDLRLALKYYEICGDHNHWEGGGQAGLMQVWGIGMSPEERDLGKAYAYFAQGTPGGLEGCNERWKKRKRQNQKKDGVVEEVTVCDRHCVNGMGLLHLLGVEGLVDRDVNAARRWFEHGKDFGDPESIYNYAMLRLGWMVAELKDLPTKQAASLMNDHNEGAFAGPPPRKTAFDQNYMAHRSEAPRPGSEAEARAKNEADTYSGPTASDYNVAVQEFARAASKGHLQARHKLGMLYAAGASVPKKKGQRPTKVVAQNCPSALRYFKSVADTGHAVSRRNRAAWKQYGRGEHESALRNYLASAEAGNEVGQVNAAFLLEQGHCLGMTTRDCTRASVRLWRAAARQGNLEACLRVGDFYYYGRMKAKPSAKDHDDGDSGVMDGGEATLYDREEYLASLEAKAFYFIPGPYQWTRYILYPEELFDLVREGLHRWTERLQRYMSSRKSGSEDGEDGETTPSAADDATCDDADGTCAPEWTVDEGAGTKEKEEDEDSEDDSHMAIAAQYYRKAAEEHKSARANFNLGFMHEWGLGLTQDFPLAKRHYDMAGEDGSNVAAAIALRAMDLHQRAVKLGMMLKDYDRYYTLISKGISTSLEGDTDATPLSTESEKEGKVTDLDRPSSDQPADDGHEGRSSSVGPHPSARSLPQGEDWDQYIPIEDVINSFLFANEHATVPGHFPDRFETGDFDGLPWTETHLWTVDNTNVNAPFRSKYSAFTESGRVSTTKRSSLKLEVNSANGGRICFYLFAEVGLPFEDLRLYRNAETYHQFVVGTNQYPNSWLDYCFEIPAGKQVLEWSLAYPAYYDDKFKDLEEKVEIARRERRLSGHVFVDNVRFFPHVYDDFETGDFSLQKWRQFGDGAPWVISDVNAFGRYAAHAGSATDSMGMSSLELAVDLGYTGALLTFWVKVVSNNVEDCVWFFIDRQKIRPWFDQEGHYAHYTHYIGEGVHRLTWSFVNTGKDPEAGAWLDDMKFYTREGDDLLRPEFRDLGWKGRDKGIGPPGWRTAS